MVVEYKYLHSMILVGGVLYYLEIDDAEDDLMGDAEAIATGMDFCATSL